MFKNVSPFGFSPSVFPGVSMKGRRTERFGWKFIKAQCGQGSLKIELISKGQKKTKPQKTNKQKTLKTFIKLSISCLFFPLRNQLIYLQKNPKNNPPKNQNKNLPAQGKAMPSSKRILWVEATRKFQEKWVRKNSLFSLVPSHHISIYSPPTCPLFLHLKPSEVSACRSGQKELVLTTKTLLGTPSRDLSSPFQVVGLWNLVSAETHRGVTARRQKPE